jgi:multiple sugar transport system substrate-binding protein
MKKAQLAIGATIAAIALALTGCSGSGGGSGGKVVLQEEDYYALTSPQGKALKALFAEYHQTHPNVTIESTKVVQNLVPKLQSQATTNSLPDLAIVDNPDFPVINATGKLQEIPLKDWKLGDAYIPGAQKVVTDKSGKVHGIFIGTNALAIEYNKDMFAAAGITEPPKTWDEFLAVAKKVTKPGVLGFMFAGSNNGCSAWQFDPWRWTAGGSDDKLDDPGNVKALEFWKSLIDAGVSSKDVVNQCQDESAVALVKGQVAMIENGPWEFGVLNAATNLKWDAFTIPVPTAGDKLQVPLGGEVWTAPKTGDKAREAAALDFLKWSQSKSVLKKFDAALGYVPVMSSLLDETTADNPQMAAFVESVKGARGRTSVLGTKTSAQVASLGTAIQSALTGQASPKDALVAAQKDFASK